MAVPHICITEPHALPADWKLYTDKISVPTERDMSYRNWMTEHFWSHISSLGIDTVAIAFAAMHALGRTSSLPPTLEKFAGGSYNVIFTATFPPSSTNEQEFKVAIRIPRRKHRISGRVAATVAMMTFARLYLGLPVPKVYAWNDSSENPVNAPYTIMEFVPGKTANSIWYYGATDQEHWYKIIDASTRTLAWLAKPLPWTGYGSVYFVEADDERCFEDKDLMKLEAYRLGPLITGPTAAAADRNSFSCQVLSKLSLKEFWKMLWEKEVSHVKRLHLGELTTPLKLYEIDYDDEESDDEDSEDEDSEPEQTLADFLTISDRFHELIEKCPLPDEPSLYEPCLVPMDFALRNFIIDPISFEFKSYLDWDDYAVLPFILCSKFIHEIAEEPGVTEQWLVEEGGFPFIPPIEEGRYEGEVEELLQSRVDEAIDRQRRYESSQRRCAKAKQAVQSGKQTNGKESSEVKTDEAKGENGERTQPDSTYSDIDWTIGETERQNEYLRTLRVFNTHFQREYIKRLEGLDERFAIPGFWKAREDALKIHHLLISGWTQWVEKADWIDRRLKQINEGKGYNRSPYVLQR